MKLSWDEAKRRGTLVDRGLDFASSTELFNGVVFTVEDIRKDYGETRFISSGFIAERLCFVVWTPREDCRHIISLRKANDREKKRFSFWLESGR